MLKKNNIYFDVLETWITAGKHDEILNILYYKRSPKKINNYINTKNQSAKPCRGNPNERNYFGGPKTSGTCV